MEELVGRKEAGRCSALHERDREVATNAVTGQHDPRMRRFDGQPLPRACAQQRAVVIDQPLLRDDRGSLELRIDPMQLSQQPILHHPLI